MLMGGEAMRLIARCNSRLVACSESSIEIMSETPIRKIRQREKSCELLIVLACNVGIYGLGRSNTVRINLASKVITNDTPHTIMAPLCHQTPFESPQFLAHF
jgi:hypothetical protein